MLNNLTIRGRLNLLAMIVIVGNLAIAATIWIYVGKFASHFEAYSKLGEPIERYALLVDRDRNDYGRLVKHIFLGDDYAQTFALMEARERTAIAAFDELQNLLGKIKGQGGAEYAKLESSLAQARIDTLAFMAEGNRIVTQLGASDRSEELLRRSWLEYGHVTKSLYAKSAESMGRLERDVSSYLDKVYADAEASKSFLRTVQIVATGLVTVIGQLLFFLIAQGIRHPVNLLRGTIREIEQDGDLRRRVKYDHADELGTVAHSLNAMLGKFQESMVRVSSSANALRQSSQEVERTAEQVLRSTNQQEAEISQVAAAMHEMAASIQEVAQNAQHAAQNTSTAETQAMNGRQVVSQSAESIQTLAGEIEQAAQVIRQLEQDGNRIGMVVDVIRGIAEQTNLLALNAAIEAARAGEQGRGFAVVADEVRNLASKTQASTQEIQQMIESLQLRTGEAAEVMQAGQARARESVEQAQQAGEALVAITEAIERINDMTTQIAHATEQQSEVAEEISRSVTNISGLAHGATQEVQSTVRGSEELARLAESLQGLVRQFRV
ncbi:methyl-accepting chemotaxis protein [Thiofaba sp. EF100]|uniref:methyl-accepting chemotaxis protein n=1 Tax=Thiofaba sp. EF100 TaxID=3121274 RepID=UPI0032222010